MNINLSPIRHPPLLRLLVLIVMTVSLLTGCALPRVSAEERLFLDLSLEFLGEYQLPKQAFEDTPVGGLSAITYDRQRDRFYAVSDDRSDRAPARFYTLKLDLQTDETSITGIEQIEIEGVTFLKNEAGELYAAGTIDPEGVALSPRQSVFISSEGVAREGIPPFVDEFDLASGAWQKSLPIPSRYTPQEIEGEQFGVQDNLAFEALTLNPGGFSSAWLEPFRLFVATESALHQDLPDPAKLSAAEPTAEQLERPVPARFLHYLIGDQLPTLISEHMYPIDPLPTWAIVNGLTELLVLDQGGHFLGLERSLGLTGFGARLYQAATGGATDTSGIPSLSGALEGLQPIRKQLLLDLSEIGITLDNLEGMTLGPQLPDGSQSLLLISDDNFHESQVNQFLLFRLRGIRAS